MGGWVGIAVIDYLSLSGLSLGAQRSRLCLVRHGDTDDFFRLITFERSETKSPQKPRPIPGRGASLYGCRINYSLGISRPKDCTSDAGPVAAMSSGSLGSASTAWVPSIPLFIRSLVRECNAP